MFEVACPSCKATYQVDERRVPATGLKMRCPKCGESFQVAAPGASGDAPVLGAALGLGKGPAVPAAAPNPLASLGTQKLGKSTVLGVAPSVEPTVGPKPGPAKPPAPVPRGLKSTMIGVAPAQAEPAPKAPAAPVAAAPAAAAPAAPRPAPPRAAPPRPAPPVPAPISPSKATFDLDLPEEEPLEELADDELEADLPAVPVGARGASVAPAKAPEPDGDLPAPVRRKNLFPSVDALDFDAPEPRLPFEDDEDEIADLPSAVGGVDDELDLEVARSSIPSPEQPTTVRPAKTGAAKANLAAEIDLPSIPPPAGASGPELDLPAPAPIVGLPAHRRAPADHPTTRLPAVTGRAAAKDVGVGLPVVSARGPVALPSLDDELPDLLADLPTVGGDLPDLYLGDDLPDLAAGLPIVGAAGLPMPAAGLPMPGAGLPMPGAGLPMPGAGLPMPGASLPMQAAGLPTPGGSLPSPAAALPNPAAGLPGGLSGLPRGSVRPARSDSGAAHLDDFGTRSPADFGDVDFGAEASFGSVAPAAAEAAVEDEGEFDAFPTEEADASSGARRAGEGAGRGNASWGEVALEGGGGGGIALEEEPERPRADAGPRVAPLPVAGAAASAPVAETKAVAVLPQEKRPISRGAKIAIATTISLAVAGGALSVLPEVGPYGAYVVMDALKAKEQAAALDAVHREADKLLALDTVAGADQAFVKAEQAQQAAPRYKPLRAYAAYLGFLRQVRFGRDAQSFSRAKVLLDSLEKVEPTPMSTLAKLARDSAEGKAGLATSAQALLKSSKDLDTSVLVGEVALLSGNKELALAAWQQAGKAQSSPRTQFGLARAESLAEKNDEALKLAEAVLAKSPGHTGARLLIARMRLGDRARDAELLKDLEALTAPNSGASQTERVEAFNLQGRLHFMRSRITRAEESFTKALTMQSNSVEAMTGLGDALFVSGRSAEALARFEAASKIAPDDLGAQLGVVRAKLALESLEDAAKILDALRTSHPKSSAVAYWFGRAKELVGERELALKAYKSSVELGEDVPELVMAYIGLTRLLGQIGETGQAAKEIQTALEKFPDRPEVYVAVGDLATSQAAYERAIAQYDKGLSLDPADIGIHFKRGVALRRARNFEAAQKEFELVAKTDPEFPGLALEWGLFYEASGRSAEALASYEAALKKAPNDPDLMLRVGCSKASAGQAADAEKLLRTVLSDRPNSGETNHCLGRAILLSGETTRLPEALRYLERAVVLDANRAEHHLYVGWAANELNDPAKAQQALDQALKLDQTLADAYWQRGVLRGRQGAVRDAVTDLEHALELSPSRYEAYAALADAYFNLGREPEALEAWSKAISKGPALPVWHYRYGKLLLDNRRTPEARSELDAAIEGGTKLTPKPPWVWEAHRLLALLIGRDPAAIPHWEAFVVNVDSNSPYRAEAMRALKALGQ